ncbi:cell division topological specificity factor [Striga asiatica]|uniref:Cell division topological specificity factor n=1 Tax=Striga asiatica TaxID=4170 RepID=A0A5A7Q7P9_STRAF|nr:cell division topological specificity factor [Striga asiatica]
MNNPQPRKANQLARPIVGILSNTHRAKMTLAIHRMYTHALVINVPVRKTKPTTPLGNTSNQQSVYCMEGENGKSGCWAGKEEDKGRKYGNLICNDSEWQLGDGSPDEQDLAGEEGSD